MDLKNKLKNLMITEHRDESLRLVYNQKLYDFAGNHIGCSDNIDLFSSDLTSPNDAIYDIMRIFEPIGLDDFILILANNNKMEKFTSDNINEFCYLKPIWERKRKTMTVSQIEKELGYSIEIVSEEDV